VVSTQLKRIILCERLAFETQLRTAIPDFQHHDLYLDVNRGRDSSDPLYIRKVIHHEFFHIIDYCLDHLDRDEDGWAALNPPGFKYGGGGEFYQNNQSTSELNELRRGFLNEYSTSGLAEDKAEIFAHMVVNREVAEQRGERDGIIKKKMQKMEEFLKRLCSLTDSEWKHFWDGARQLARPKEIA
jgi:hypothetical protein